MKRRINKILVANRGEIAVRVIKTCREMGIKTVAVYSEVDAQLPHVRLADDAHCVGPAAARESYLNQLKILEVALEAGVDAVHPGYGFLSENAEFVNAVQKAGLVFIGPDAPAICKMGDKTAARRLAQSLGVPIVPGTTKPVSTLEEAESVSSKIGYPILLKAAGGGGGKGMRIVRKKTDLASSLRASKSEARSAFADDRVYIEKFIENPRHIEVQILADHHGNAVHLGERECSIQRRHQKIIEESPSTIVDESVRHQITQAALELVRASGYVNAGTIEFIFDSDRKFYFLEMNTRLQVEHPVTEFRIGRDLVREQIGVAQGYPLSFSQNDVEFQGHSIECRLYAEDPMDNFFPSTGKIVWLRAPSGFGIREDRGIEEGNEITTYYDPIISKLVVWGMTREEAIERMSYAIDSYELFGIRNNLRLCRWVMQHDKFRAGEFDTNFLTRFFGPNSLDTPSPDTLRTAAVAAALWQTEHSNAPGTVPSDGAVQISKWSKKRIEQMG
jgi:acetyl-CoA carboxylase biotin carboxylase subunit